MTNQKTSKEAEGKAIFLAFKKAHDDGADYWIYPKTNKMMCFHAPASTCGFHGCPFCGRFIAECSTVHAVIKDPLPLDKGESIFIHSNWWMCDKCICQKEKIVGSLKTATVTLSHLRSIKINKS